MRTVAKVVGAPLVVDEVEEVRRLVQVRDEPSVLRHARETHALQHAAARCERERLPAARSAPRGRRALALGAALWPR